MRSCRCWPKGSRRAAAAAARYLHRDAVNRKLRDRKGLRLTAITCGGTIPDTADYNVVLEPEQQIIGTVNEDFAVESMAGDIFQLGNTSYRILRVEAGRVRVEDARGLPPSIPFWLGEAPARTDEVSGSVSRLREEIERGLDRSSVPHPSPAPSQGEGRSELAGTGALPCSQGERARRAAVAHGRGRDRACCRRSDRRLLRWRARRARPAAYPEAPGVRALLRRDRRHAAPHPFALRQPHQPRLGLEPAQALLPQIQLRAAGGRDRGRDHPVADRHAQLPARGSRALSAFEQRARAARSGVARCAHVHDALALERLDRARAAALQGRQQGAAAAPAHGSRGLDRGGVPRPARLPGEHRRRPRDPRSPAGEPDHRRLPARGHGHRRHGAPAARSGIRRHFGDRPQSARRRLRSRWRCSLRGRTPSSTTRRSRSAARRPSSPGAGSIPTAPPTSAGSIPRPSPACARKPGPLPRTADELHDALLWLGYITQGELAANPGWERLAFELAALGRATALAREARGARREARDALAPSPSMGEGWGEGEGTVHGAAEELDSRASRLVPRASVLWAATERLPELLAVFPDATAEPPVQVPAQYAQRAWTREEALVELVRGRLEGLGPTTAAAIAGSAGRAAVRHRPRAARAGRRRLRHARQLHAGRRRHTMVRAPPAGTHQPLHGQAPAPGDRAGRQRRFPALPVRLAARHAGRAHGGARCGRRRDLPAGGLRGRRGCLGSGDSARARIRLRAGLAG